MNGRDRYSKTIILTSGRSSGRMVGWSEVALFSPEDVGVQVQFLVWILPFFFSLIVFLRFGFLLFILTADPVSFARFLRKRISSIIYKGID